MGSDLVQWLKLTFHRYVNIIEAALDNFVDQAHFSADLSVLDEALFGMGIDGDVEGGQVLDQAQQNADQIEVRGVAYFHFVDCFRR